MGSKCALCLHHVVYICPIITSKQIDASSYRDARKHLKKKTSPDRLRFCIGHSRKRYSLMGVVFEDAILPMRLVSLSFSESRPPRGLYHDPSALTFSWMVHWSVCRFEGRSVGPSMRRSICRSVMLWYYNININITWFYFFFDIYTHSFINF